MPSSSSTRTLPGRGGSGFCPGSSVSGGLLDSAKRAAHLASSRTIRPAKLWRSVCFDRCARARRLGAGPRRGDAAHLVRIQWAFRGSRRSAVGSSHKGIWSEIRMDTVGRISFSSPGGGPLPSKAARRWPQSLTSGPSKRVRASTSALAESCAQSGSVVCIRASVFPSDRSEAACACFRTAPSRSCATIASWRSPSNFCMAFWYLSFSCW